MKAPTHEVPGILAAAERQMHVWAMTKEFKDRVDRGPSGRKSTRQAVQFITISREAGAGGAEIGHRVGERLGWNVFDRNLLDSIAEQFHLPRMMLDLVDETHSNWVYDVLGTWMDRQLIPHEKFVACLARIVLAVARQGKAVFIGRGTQFLLPRQDILNVRIIAPLDYRIHQIMLREGTNETCARRKIRDLDEGRREFAEQYFHRDITDPHLYDLVINVGCSGVDMAMEEIVATVV